MNLHQLTGSQVYLEKARSRAKELLSYSIPGYSGHCWGYPFDWQHSGGSWPKNTPYITVTPYCYEAFATLHQTTGDPFYAEIVASIARFVFTDLLETPTSPRASASSYSPLAKDKVVNVSAYRAFVLFDAARRLESKPSRKRPGGISNLSWKASTLMAPGSTRLMAARPFIDHFHTCFVLKCLHKMNRSMDDPRVEKALRDGYGYYRRALFEGDDEPKSFAVEPRARIVRLEMYDVAEAITLGTLLRAEMPEALALSHKLALRVCRQYQMPDGHFITRIYRGGRRHTQPYLRWPQAQVFYALTNVLRVQPKPSPNNCNMDTTPFLKEYSSRDAILKYSKATAGYGISYLLEQDYKAIYLQALRLLPALTPPKKSGMLEFGCGAGMNLLHLISVLESEGYEIESAVGSDFSAVLIQTANQEAQQYASPEQQRKITFGVAGNETLLEDLSTVLSRPKSGIKGSFHFIFGVNTIRYCHRAGTAQDCAQSIYDLLAPVALWW